MSAGVFVNSKYEATYDPTRIHPIRVQPETALQSLGEDSLAGINNPISARVSAGKRSKGLIARSITMRLNDATPIAGYKPGSVTRIPILTNADFAAASAQVGAERTYLAGTWTVIGRSPEIAR